MPGLPQDFDSGNDPVPTPNVDTVSLDETVTRALAALLDALTPAQRVAYVLHDVFGVPYATVAGVVGRSTRQTRDLASAARRAIRMPTPVSGAGSRDAVVRAFLHAATDRDATALSALLAAGVMVLTDQPAPEIAAPVTSIPQATALVLRTLDELQPQWIREQSVNGQAGIVIGRDDRVVGVICLNVVAELVSDVWIVLDPDKLHGWNH